MYPPPNATKPCPGAGCENRVGWNTRLCSACLEVERVELDAGLRDLARLPGYLARWATFEERYGPN